MFSYCLDNMAHLTIIFALIALVVVPIIDGIIVGGENATIEEFPYQLSLQSYGVHICGASILNETLALTAAHCTIGKNVENLSVRAGSSCVETGGQVVRVAAFCNHYNYSAILVNNDVSVLKLASPLNFSSTIQPISLVDLGSDVAAGTFATVSGWGRLKFNKTGPVQLQRVRVPKINQTDCERFYSYRKITGNMMCFGYPTGGKDTCKGDSGGPLVIDGKQVGIVSWGRGCGARRRPGVYTNLAAPSIIDHIINNDCLNLN